MADREMQTSLVKQLLGIDRPAPGPEMPATVRILGFQVALETAPCANDPNLDGKYGYADHGRMRIRLREDNPPDEMRETALHEVLHFLDEAVQAGLTEEQVRRLARGLYAVLRDDPAFAAWLMAP